MSSSPSPVPVVPTLITTGRFANTNEFDHSGAIWISTILCLIYSTLVLVLRAHLRWAVRSLDDYILFGATLIQTGEVAALIYSLKHGLGQSHLLLTEEQLRASNIATFASILLFVASTTAAKLSVVALMMRLFNLKGPRASRDSRSRTTWAVCLGVAVTVLLWGIGSIIGLSANCTVSNLTMVEATNMCSGQALRWDLITTFDILAEMLIVILSVVIVWPVQIKFHMKVPVVFAFSFRLGCALISLVHLHYIHLFSDSINNPTPPLDSNPGLTIVPVLVLMQVQLCWSMISATIPNLKSFVRSFNSGCGLGLDSDFMDSYMLSDRDRSRSRDTTARRNTDNDTGTVYELAAVKTHLSTATATTTYSKPRLASIPARPSRKNVDLEGIGFHAGIPAIPGFGASGYSHRSSYTTPTKSLTAKSISMSECTPNSSAISSPVFDGESLEGESGRRTPVCEIEGSEITIGCAVSSGSDVASGAESREQIIRKDMQYEVRYEMA